MKTRLMLSLVGWMVLGLGTVEAQIVVVNRSVKAEVITKSDLRDIFLGASTNYKDGSHAVPVTLKAGATHEQFLKEYVGKNDASFRAAWRALLFSGQGTIPKAFDSEAGLIEYIASVPGAIGYVGSAPNHEKVRTVSVK